MYHGRKAMIIVIGEILVDCFADYERIGGAPFNFAYHLKRMGWPVRFISRIGNDAYGDKILGFLEQAGFSARDIQTDRTHATGKVAVALDGRGIPEFTICEDAAYDYIDPPPPEEPGGGPVEMVYYGSLAQRTAGGFDRIGAFLDQIPPETLRFCDINLRPPHIRDAAVTASLKRVDMLKLNEEELTRIGELCRGPANSDDIPPWLTKSFGISAVAVTRGERGSSLYRPRRTTHSPPVRVERIVDTVGAGDAYAAVLAAGTLMHLPDDEILGLATRFAAGLCGIPGALPNDDRLYAQMTIQMERIRHDR
jgi:fructokinase